jgi:hypothetical protein
MRFLHVGLGILLALSAARAAENSASLAIARVDAALETIAKSVRPGRVGYATVYDANKYVQCRRLPDRAMRCEAAGAAMQPALAAVLTRDRVRALATLGWRLDPAFGNYVRLFPADMPTREIAAHIVRTLHEAYGSNPVDLERATAFVEDVPCPPRNGPEQTLAGLVNDDPAMQRIRTCAYDPGSAPQKLDSAAALVARSGATAAAEIERLRRNAERHVFVIFDTGVGYVQCGPESPQALYCEAQSPRSGAALTAVITPDRLARLHALGYADPGRGTNYWKRYRFDAYADAAIAADVLTVLHDVYGYDGATPLDIKTE